MTVVLSEADKRRRRSRRTWALVVIGAGLAVTGVLLARALGPAPFFDQIAGLRAAGYATTLDEHCGPQPLAVHDGAPDLLAARADLVAREGPLSSWTVAGPWDPSDRGFGSWPMTTPRHRFMELMAFLDRIEPFYGRVDVALARPRLWLAERPFSWDGAVRVQQLFQDLQWLLSARAEAHRSDASRLSACAIQLRLASRIDVRNLFEARLVGLIRWRAMETLRRLVEHGVVSPAEARDACDGYLRDGLVRRFPRAVRGEIAFLAEASAAVYRGSAEPPELALPSGTGWSELDATLRSMVGAAQHWPNPREQAAYLATLRSVAATDPSDVVAWLERVETLLLQAPDSAWPTASDVRANAEMLARLDAAAAVTRVGMAAVEFRDAQGRWPESEEDLRTAFPAGVPLDPFTGGPLALERRGPNLRIASRWAVASKPPIAAEALSWSFVVRERLWR